MSKKRVQLDSICLLKDSRRLTRRRLGYLRWQTRHRSLRFRRGFVEDCGLQILLFLLSNLGRHLDRKLDHWLRQAQLYSDPEAALG